MRPKLGALPIYKGLRLLLLVYFVFYCLTQPRAFVLGLFYLLFTMPLEMYQDLIQYQAKRIESLTTELKTQEAKYKELHANYKELHAVGLAVAQALQNEIKELKKKLNDEK